MAFVKLFRYSILILLFCCFKNSVSGQSRLIQQELHGLPNIKDSLILINSLNRLGTLYRTKNVDSCFYYGMRAKSMATRLHYPKGQADADNVIALALYNRGLYKESFELFSKVLSYYQQEADTANIALTYLNMADLTHRDLGNQAKINSLLHKAIQAGSTLKKDSVMARLYLSYCILKPQLPEDSVNYYLRRSREVAIRYKNQYALIYGMQFQAQIFLGKGKKKEALPLINQSLTDARNAGIEQSEINSLYLLAQYYQDRPKKALEYCYQGYELVRKIGYTNQEVYILTAILELTELSGSKDEIINAHRALEKAMLTESANVKKFVGDYVKYGAIQDDNTMLGRKNQRKTVYLIAVILFLGVVILVLLTVWLKRKRLASLNKKISTQNVDMQKALIALEQSQEENTRIMKIVAHDLRSPMAATISIADLLLDNENLQPEDKEMLGLMKTSSLHSLEMITDLLNMNIAAEGLKKEPVEMHTLLNYCVNLLKFKATEKKQKIQLEAEQIVMTVNREKIWRVISNLIVNAVKFSPEGSVIQVKMKREGEKVQIRIQDEGIGIPENLKDKIFTMFTDARRSGTSGEQSFGLGLAISRQIVEAHGGKIWFESNADQGTIFFVDLPII